MSAAAPRAVPPVPETELVESIRDVSQVLVQRLVPQMVSQGLGAHTFWPLHYLERGAGHHPSELARRLAVTPAACTASVDQLVALGYVVRRPSGGDRRQVVLAVTPKGRHTLETVWRRFDASVQDLLSDLPRDEVAVTARTLRTIAARLRTGPVDDPVTEDP